MVPGVSANSHSDPLRDLSHALCLSESSPHVTGRHCDAWGTEFRLC